MKPVPLTVQAPVNLSIKNRAKRTNEQNAYKEL